MPVKENISNEEYHLNPALSASGAKTIALQSLAHFKYAKRKVTTAFDVGTAVHTLVLEPHPMKRRCRYSCACELACRSLIERQDRGPAM